MNYFIGCPHFSRTSTNTLNRPFKDTLEMSSHILERINLKVPREDRLFILGDFAFTELETRYWRNRIKCECFLICGNHDITNIEKLYDIFGRYSVRSVYETKCCDQKTWLSHYPHLYWPKSHYGSYHLFSHVHDMRTETIEETFPEIRAMDVGADAAKRILGDYEPFSEQEIHDILSIRKGHDTVEFYIQKRGAYKKDHKHD